MRLLSDIAWIILLAITPWWLFERVLLPDCERAVSKRLEARCMKCEKCGQEINNLLVDVFRYDGSDDFDNHPIFECEENAAYIETTQNWTGYEQSEEEMLDTIVCPYCKQFPFQSKEIQVYDVVRVVCFKKGEALKDGKTD